MCRRRRDHTRREREPTPGWDAVPAAKAARPPRRPLLGWLALLGAAVCLDLAKVWVLLTIAWVAGVPALAERGDVAVLILAAFLVSIQATVGAMHLLRLAKRCFFPQAPEAAQRTRRRRRRDGGGPEWRRCGVPVGPNRPGPLVARARPEQEMAASI